MNSRQSDPFEVDLKNGISTRISMLLCLAILLCLTLHGACMVSNAFLGGQHPVSVQLSKLFWLGRENNLPSWFSSCLLWSSGVLLILIAMVRQTTREQYVWYWAVLGLIFCALSLDESIALHEWLIVPVRERLGVSGGFFYFAWIIPAMIALVIGGLLYIPFLRYIPRNLAKLFIAAGALYVFGAVGMEMVGGAAMSETINTDLYEYYMLIEESCEMFGIVLFIHGLTATILSGQTAASEFEPMAAE